VSDHDAHHHGDHPHEHGDGCLAAHGERPADLDAGTLVTVYASPVAEVLLRWGRELGYRTVLLDPDPARVDGHLRAVADEVLSEPSSAPLGDRTDVVICDHHRDDLGPVSAPLVRAGARWIGIMGNPRHEGPHVAALRAQGVADDVIATVRRPIGLDLGPTKAPAEIALSTLAELVANRNGRPRG
jgi:xanthine dehydrogenase accessory factor